MLVADGVSICACVAQVIDPPAAFSVVTVSVPAVSAPNDPVATEPNVVAFSTLAVMVAAVTGPLNVAE